MSTDNSLNLSSISDDNDNVSIVEINGRNPIEPNSANDVNPTTSNDLVTPNDAMTAPMTSNKTEASTKHGMLLEIQCLLSVPCYEAIGKKDMKKMKL